MIRRAPAPPSPALFRAGGILSTVEGARMQ